MDRHIPIVISEGDPFTRGQRLGSSQAGRVRQAARAYMTLFNQFAGLSRNDVYTEVERFIPTINDHAPHLLEEIHGQQRCKE
jgi:hypothetical protein